MYVYICTSGGQSPSNGFLSPTLYFLRQGLSLNRKLANSQLDWPVKFQGPNGLCPPVLGSQVFVGMPGFYGSAGNLNSGPLGFIASALPTRSSPWPNVQFFSLGSRDQTWVLMLAWQALHLLSYFPSTTPPLFFLP